MVGWLIAAGALLLVVLAGALAAFLKVFYVPGWQKRRVPLPPNWEEEQDPQRATIYRLCRQVLDIPFEEVTITAKDGCRLYGRYYHRADGAPLQIQFHGYRSFATRDFSGGHKLARERGHNILLVDQRAHGRSGGHVLTFGIRERYDCQAWAEYAAARFPGSPILLTGVSMGAATVLMAAQLPLPAAVVGILADCPYATPAGIIRKVCGEDMGLPAPLVMPFIHLGAALYGGFRLADHGAVGAVGQAQLPVLLVHGQEDDFVPHDMSCQIAAACRSPITFLSVPHAGHGNSFLVDGDAYERAMDAFLSQVLS